MEDIFGPEVKIFAKESWFKEFYHGVSLMPQTNQGATIFLMASLLEDDNIDFQEFANCELSKDQLLFLANAMNAQHDVKKIKVKYKYSEIESRYNIVPLNRFKELFMGYKLTVINYIFIFLKNNNIINYEFLLFSIPSTEKVNFLHDFFQKKENNEVVLNLREIFRIIKETLQEEDIKELLSSYREGFKHDKKKSYSFYDKECKPKIQERIFLNLRKRFGDHLPPEVIHLIYNIFQ